MSHYPPRLFDWRDAPNASAGSSGNGFCSGGGYCHLPAAPSLRTSSPMPMSWPSPHRGCCVQLTLSNSGAERSCVGSVSSRQSRGTSVRPTRTFTMSWKAMTRQPVRSVLKSRLASVYEWALRQF